MSPQNWAMDYDFDAMAERKAALSPAEVTAFREHLDKCWKPPAALARAQNLKAVLRIALTATAPWRPSRSWSGQRLDPGSGAGRHRRRALTACQPFRFLPADKYSEWQILDLNFTPRGSADDRRPASLPAPPTCSD